MTDLPSTGRTIETVRLGVLGLGAVAQAVHLPRIERLRDHFAIAARRAAQLGLIIGGRAVA